MDAPLRRLLARCVTGIACSLQQAWHEAPAAPSVVRHGMGIAVVPSTLVRRLDRAFTLAHTGFGLELLLLGHGVASALVLAMALLPCLQRRVRRLDASPVPGRLLVAADGRLHLLHVPGDIEAVCLQNSSLRLGPWLVLTLRGRGRNMHRLVLGPDNVPVDVLAALRRRMHLVHQSAEAVAPGLAAHLSPGTPIGRPQAD